jgi:hypothetical protein
MHRSKQGLYSTTLSAIARSAGGTVKPSSAAVLRLIDSSNFVSALLPVYPNQRRETGRASPFRANSGGKPSQRE